MIMGVMECCLSVLAVLLCAGVFSKNAALCDIVCVENIFMQYNNVLIPHDEGVVLWSIV